MVKTAVRNRCVSLLAHLGALASVKPARDTLAEVALTRVNDISEGDGVWGQIGIIQTVSNNGVENFDPYRQGVFRKGMTSVTFEVFVWNSFARGRYFLNFWS